MNDLRVIAITHKNFPLEVIGGFHLDPERRQAILKDVMSRHGIAELMYLSTCNRVEVIFTVDHYVCPGFTAVILDALGTAVSEETIREVSAGCDRYNGAEAVDHLIRVACSLDSAILGEREIITQLRKSFEESIASDLCGDSLRMVVAQCIRTSKEVFTHTELARRPVSAVSLAWQEFRKAGLGHDTPVLLIGAGQVIRNFTKFLSENNYHNITIANRTLARAEALLVNNCGRAITLEELHTHGGKYEVMISCTSSEQVILTEELYDTLVLPSTGRRLIIDLALPRDVHPAIAARENVHYIGMEQIRETAAENIAYRQQALAECEILIAGGKKDFEKASQQRQIERAMQAIPEAVKDIRNTALGSVFAKDLEKLDEQSREIIEKIMTYMEKKYISIPMKMAREVLMNEVIKN